MVNVVAIVAGRRNPQPEAIPKFVDIQYAADSGIQKRLEDAGYSVSWCKESKLSRRVDIDGYEVVAEPDSQGELSTYHVKDALGDLVLAHWLPQRAQPQCTPPTSFCRQWR